MDIAVVDKAEVAAGASRITCGVVLDFYYQPAMGAVMGVSLDVWEPDPEAFHFHNCQYIALVPSSQDGDVEAIYKRQRREGYPSTLVQREQRVFDHMRAIFPDWKARGQTSMLQEHRSGFAFNADAVRGLADKARAAGARVIEGVGVTGFRRGSDGSVIRVVTTEGKIEAGFVIVGAGPWIGQIWEMLELSDRLDVRRPDCTVHADQPMWNYWRLEEGEVTLDPAPYRTDDGRMPPVFHFDSRDPAGGVGCSTCDNFPIFDFAPGIANVYMIADSNHGFKMIGVGKEVAKLLGGGASDVLRPFRFARFAEGDLHPPSASPWPWG